jgi:RNA polymerase sigma-70 factor (TIGR02943 family)
MNTSHMTQENDSHGTFRSWVVSYTDSLYSWACSKINDKAAAEDLVQETFLSAFQSFDKFRAESSPKTWLFSILNNKIVDHFRQNLKAPVVSQDAAFFEIHFDHGEHWHRTECVTDWQGADVNLLDNNDFQGILQKCMQKLPGNWNTALQLKYLGEKDSKEVCQDLQISPSNFWQLMHRAKLQLRKCLELNWFKK